MLSPPAARCVPASVPYYGSKPLKLAQVHGDRASILGSWAPLAMRVAVVPHIPVRLASRIDRGPATSRCWPSASRLLAARFIGPQCTDCGPGLVSRRRGDGGDDIVAM